MRSQRAQGMGVSQQWGCGVLTVCHSGTSTQAPKHQERMNMTAMVKSPRPTASAMRARPFVRGARSCNQHSPFASGAPQHALLLALLSF